MLLRILIALSALVTPLLALTQDDRKVEKQYDRALQLLYEEHFDLARIEFEELYLVRPNFRDVAYRREITYFLDGDHNRSLNNLLEYEGSEGGKDKFYHYWLGRVFVTKYMFGEAIGSWINFLNKDVYKSKEIRQETNDFIESTKALSAFFENNADYVVTLLPETINTEFAELNPAFSYDNQELLYTTSRINEDNQEVFEIWGSKLIDQTTADNFQWSEPYRIPNLNNVEENNVRYCLTYQDKQVETLVAKNNGELFSIGLTEDGWGSSSRTLKQVKLPNLGPDFTVNRSQNRIIFSSTKGYRKTRYNLYETRYDSLAQKWSKPVPVEELNTEMDESSPFLSYDEKTLYFSSNGHNAIGGFDIFYSKWNEAQSKWNSPVQMNYPINTPDDEIHFKLAKDGASGYFSSNRVYSRGDFDIFHFRIVPKSKISGKILLSSTLEPVPDVQIIFLPNQYVSERYATNSDQDGAFEMQLISEETYTVQVKRGGVLEVEDQLSIGDKEVQVLNFLISDTQEAAEASGIELVEVSEQEPDQNANIKTSPFVAAEQSSYVAAPEKRLTTQEIENRRKAGYKLVRQNIYFQTGGAGINQGTRTVLEKAVKLLHARQDLQIEIGGHTDNIGDALQNLRLSYRRAEMVKRWLTDMGIDPERMVVKGYGESTPLSTNDDEEEGRELNRRVELRVIGSSL